MNIAHMVVVTPGRCGLYETTWETAHALRCLGHDARLVDPSPESNPVSWRGDADRGMPVDTIRWAELEADVIVSHSGYGDHFKETKIPIVYVAHGRPRVSYLTEKAGGIPVYSHHFRMNDDARVKAVVTYWPQHVPYLQALMPDKRVVAVPAPTNLQHFTLAGEKHDFGGEAGQINVVIADAWREDVDPFTTLNAAIIWARQQINSVNPVKIHVYGKPKGLPGAGALIVRMQRDGILGENVPWVDDLAPIYRGADYVFTNHDIAVRTVREAMACGCPVVHIGDDLAVELPEMSRMEARLAAERLYNPTRTAAAFAALLESL